MASPGKKSGVRTHADALPDYRRPARARTVYIGNRVRMCPHEFKSPDGEKKPLRGALAVAGPRAGLFRPRPPVASLQLSKSLTAEDRDIHLGRLINRRQFGNR